MKTKPHSPRSEPVPRKQRKRQFNPQLTPRALRLARRRLDEIPGTSIAEFFGRDLKPYRGPVIEIGQPIAPVLEHVLGGNTVPIVSHRRVSVRVAVRSSRSKAGSRKAVTLPAQLCVSRLVGALSLMDVLEALKRCAESRHCKRLGFFDADAMHALQHVGTPIAHPLTADAPMTALLDAMKTPKTGIFVIGLDGQLCRLSLGVILRRLFEHSPILITGRPVGRTQLGSRKGRRAECRRRTKLLKLTIGGIIKSKRRQVRVADGKGETIGILTPSIVLGEMVRQQAKFLRKVRKLPPRKQTAKLARQSPLFKLTVKDVLSKAMSAKKALRLDWQDKLDDRREGKPIWQLLIEQEQAFVYRDGKCVGIIHSAWLMSDEILPIALRLFFGNA